MLARQTVPVGDLVPRAGDSLDIRVSDVERQETVDVLRRFCADGFLTLDEFSDRVERALASRTRGDLVTVTADLPVTQEATPPAPQRRRERTTTVFAMFSGNRRRGRWRVGERVTAIAIMGGAEVDLRDAEIDCPEVTIVAFALWGGVEIIVPEGVPVELTGVPIFGGKHYRVAEVPPLPGAPRIIVKAFPVMGGIGVRTKRRGRRPRPERDTRHEHHRSQRRLVDEPPSRLPADLHGTVTLLFTDIEGSSRLFNDLGDFAAQEVIRDHHALLAAQAEVCGGHVVKTQGDGAMIAFRGASQALRCAVATQEAIEKWNAGHGSTPLRVRMGLHTGEAIREGDDFAGRAVVVAARIAAEAKGGEILVSDVLHQLAASTGEFSFEAQRSVDLRGLDGSQVVYALRW